MSAESQEFFAQELIDVMQERRADWQFKLDMDDFSVEAVDATGTRQAVVRLDKLYAKYLAASSDEERQQTLAEFANLIVSTGTPESFLEAKRNLMPLIKDRWYIEVLNVSEKLAVSAGKSDGSMFLPSYNLTDEISVLLSFEMPHVRSLITAGKLKGWGISFEEGMQLAVDAMRNHTAPQCNGMVYQDESRPYAFVSTWEDSSDASRVLLHDVMASFPVFGDLIVAMPHAGELVITGSEEIHGLELIVERYKLAYQHESRYLPPLPLLWKDGVLSRLQIPESHNAYRALESLRHLWQQDIYNQQKKMLSTEWLSLTDGCHVAQYDLLEKETMLGSMMVSNCTVPDMANVLIPETDLVTFCVLDTEGLHTRGVGTWAEVVEVLGADLVEMDFYPKLHRVLRFPTESELRFIRGS